MKRFAQNECHACSLRILLHSYDICPTVLSVFYEKRVIFKPICDNGSNMDSLLRISPLSGKSLLFNSEEDCCTDGRGRSCRFLLQKEFC